MSSSQSVPGGGVSVGSSDRPTFSMPIQTKPLRDMDAGYRADRKAPEAKNYPSSANVAVATAEAAASSAAPASPPPPCARSSSPAHYSQSSLQYQAVRRRVCQILRIRFQQQLGRTIHWGGHRGMLHRISTDIAYRPSILSNMVGRSGGRGGPNVEEE